MAYGKQGLVPLAISIMVFAAILIPGAVGQRSPPPRRPPPPAKSPPAARPPPPAKAPPPAKSPPPARPPPPPPSGAFDVPTVERLYTDRRMNWDSFYVPPNNELISTERACLAACVKSKGTTTPFYFEVSATGGCRCANGIPTEEPLDEANTAIWSVGKPFLRQYALGKTCTYGTRVSADQTRDDCYKACMQSELRQPPFFFDFGPFGCWCSEQNAPCGDWAEPLIDLPGSEVWVTGPTITTGRGGECTTANSLNPTCTNKAATSTNCSPSPFYGSFGGACAINVDSKPVCVDTIVVDMAGQACAELRSCTVTNDCGWGFQCIKGCCPTPKCYENIDLSGTPYMSVASLLARANAALRKGMRTEALASDSASINAAPAADAMGGLAAAVEAVSAPSALPMPVVEYSFSPPPPPSPADVVPVGSVDVMAASAGGVSNLVPVTMHGGTSDTSDSAGDIAVDASSP